MKTKLIVENPHSIEMTLQVTMSLKDWIVFRDNLPTNWPCADFIYAVNEMVSTAQKHFYPPGE